MGQLVNDSRNLALKARQLVGLEGVEAGDLARLVSGFAHALRMHLRTGMRLQEVRVSMPNRTNFNMCPPG